MSRIKSAFSILLLIVIILSATLSVAVLTLQNITKKENITAMVDSSSRTVGLKNQSEDSTESTSNIINIGGTSIDISKLNLGDLSFENIDVQGISTNSFSNVLNDANGLSGFLSGFPGLSGIFDSFKTIMEIFSGKTSLSSLVLNMVNGNKYVTSTDIKAAIDGTITTTDDCILMFSNTKLVNKMRVEIAYTYFDYMGNSGVQQSYKETLKQNFADIMQQHKSDFAILLGKELTAEDDLTIDILSQKISDTVIATADSPQEKTSSLSTGNAKFLKLFFSPLLMWFLIGITVLAIALYSVINIISGKSWKNNLTAISVIAILVGALSTFALGPLGNTVANMGLPDSTVPTVDGSTLPILLGICLMFAGATGIIVPLIIGKQRKRIMNAENNVNIQNSKDTQWVLDSQGLDLIRQANIMEVVVSGKKKDGPIDYYGDGRGLEQQKKWQEEHKNKNTTNKYSQIFIDNNNKELKKNEVFDLDHKTHDDTTAEQPKRPKSQENPQPVKKSKSKNTVQPATKIQSLKVVTDKKADIAVTKITDKQDKGE